VSTRAPSLRAAARAELRDATATIFRAVCKRAGLPRPVTEHPFAAEAMGRAWRFDYAWEARRVALEVEGGVWTGGRHTRPSGFLRDVEKYNAAACLGWRVLRCTPDTLCAAATLAAIRAALTTETT
jgi:hypothetical protein